MAKKTKKYKNKNIKSPKEVKKFRELSLKDKIQNFNLKIWLEDNKNYLLVLALFIFAIYANSLGNDFLSDDIPGILENPLANRWEGFLAHPLFFFGALPRFIISNIFGKVPWAFRLLNIIFHIGNCSLIFFLASLLANKKAGFIGALLAASHPIMTESITWISGSGYSQYTFFVLLGICLYIFSVKEQKFYYFSMISFLVALLTSEKSMMFPFLLLSLHLAYPKTFNNNKLFLPFILGITWIGIYVNKIPARIEGLQTLHYENPQNNNLFLTPIIAISSYFRLIFWPDKLSLYHTELSFTTVQIFYRAIVLLIYIGATIYAYFKNKKYFFWLTMLGIGLSPTLTPFGVSWIVAERYVYFGAFGIFVATGILLAKLSSMEKLKKLAPYILSVLVIALSIRTIYRNIDWKNAYNLWTATAKTAPSSPNNYNNLGDVYANMGDPKKAIENFQKAVDLKPNYADAYHNMGNVYMQMAEYEKAIEALNKAIENNPYLWQSHNLLAAIYLNTEDFAKSEEHIKKAIEIYPANPELQVDLAVILYKKGDNEGSKNILTEVLKAYPENVRARDLFFQL